MDSYDFAQAWQHLWTLGIAYLLALPVGLEREQSRAGLGVRTFPLVAIASCGYMLAAFSVVAEHAEANARIIAGLMSGIGFVGGGAILKRGDRVQGTATAAAIWSTGALGVAVALAQYEIAIVLSAMNVLTLRWVRRLHGAVRSEEHADEDDDS